MILSHKTGLEPGDLNGEVHRRCRRGGKGQISPWGLGSVPRRCDPRPRGTMAA